MLPEPEAPGDSVTRSRTQVSLSIRSARRGDIKLWARIR